MKKVAAGVLAIFLLLWFEVPSYAMALDGEITSHIAELSEDIINAVSDENAVYTEPSGDERNFNAITLSEEVSGTEQEPRTEPESETETESESETEPESETETEPAATPEPLEIRYGDIDQNGKITASDARLVLRFSAKLCKLSRRQCVLGDCNQNKTLNAADARTVLRLAANLIHSSVYVGNDSDTEMLTVFSAATPYKPTVKGFSTNITDPAVFPKVKELEKYLGSLGKTATMYYTDVNKQYYLKYNSDKVYRTQCTVKAPYVKSVLVYMEKNNISLNEKLYLKESEKWEGHELSAYPDGTAFTIRQVIYYTIRYSDNTAYQMLFDHFGSKIFNESAKKAGSSLRLGSYIFGQTSAEDMSKLYLDIYNYKGKYRDMFYDDLANTIYRSQIPSGVPAGIKVLNKIGTGDEATVGYHDCAIIFTQVPCVLIIYTSFNKDRDYDVIPFREIAWDVVGINMALEY